MPIAEPEQPPVETPPLNRSVKSNGLFGRDQSVAGPAALDDAQHEDGVWPIKWQAISPGVELEWRGRVTNDALLPLQAYLAAGYTTD